MPTNLREPKPQGDLVDPPDYMPEGAKAAWRYALECAPPHLLKRLDLSGWQHRMVIAAFIRFYGLRSLGDQWDKPTADDILAIAAESVGAGQG